MQKTFATYIKHLQNLVPWTCARCGKRFCFACGEPIELKPVSTDPTDHLFHCPNLQGVILGVGLTMLEKMFVEQTQDSSTQVASNTKGVKRRNADPLPIPADLDDDDDDETYYAAITHGKKAKLGTGYAGDVREDVGGIY